MRGTGCLLRRFLSLYWHAGYKERVTTNLAALTVALSKLALTVPVTAAALVEPSILQCVQTQVLECGIVEKLKVTLVMKDIPVLLAFTVVLLVSVYVLVVRERKAVHSMAQIILIFHQFLLGQQATDVHIIIENLPPQTIEKSAADSEPPDGEDCQW